MKEKCLVGLALVMFAGHIRGEDTVEWLTGRGAIGSVAVTATNLFIWFKSPHYKILWGRNPPVYQRTAEYIEANKPLSLMLDNPWAALGDNGGALIVFEPAAFKSQRKGFRISEVRRSGDHPFLNDVTNKVAYIVLSDTPAQAGAEDFSELIWFPKRDDGAEFLNRFPWVEASVTPDCLMMRLGMPNPYIEQDGARLSWTLADTRDGRPLILTPNQDTKIVYEANKRSYDLAFMPVSFKNQLKGFRVTAVSDLRFYGGAVTTNIVYIALSDTPVRVGEIDVAGADEAAVIQKEKAEAEREAKRKMEQTK